MLRENPTVGSGLGAYAEAYSKLPDKPQWLSESRAQPHSELILIFTQGGITAGLGLILLVGLLVRVARANVKENPQLLAVTLIIATNGLFNSVIWDFAEGHLVAAWISIVIFYAKVCPKDSQLSTAKSI